MAKLLFMFYSWITPSSSLDIGFMLGGTYVFETLFFNSSTFLNIGFWEILKKTPSKMIRSAIEIVRQVLLEVIGF